MEVSISIHRWSALSAPEQWRLLDRPARWHDASLRGDVEEILRDVRARGDAALSELAKRLDGVFLADFRVGEAEIAAAEAELSAGSIAAIEMARRNLERFHEAQRPVAYAVETMPGVLCERIPHPIDCVGLYVPAGSAPLPSTALMLSVPAAIAACPRRILCTPPRPDGRANPAVLAAARRGGITEIFKVGGAQAIAAMAYGTASIPRVDKIFGPGNAWVTTAKSLVAAEPEGPAIDMPAGPSEVLVIADRHADAEFVAADLLSQAEHDRDSQVVLVATDRRLAQRVIEQMKVQLALLARRETAAAAIAQSRFIIADDIAQAVGISNRYAPEHLIVHVRDARSLLPSIRNAGSVFLGPWSPESVGDYCSGTNHVLPTNGRARSFSGLSVDQFMRHMTVQELTQPGLRAISGAVTELAGLEGLGGHAEAVSRRVRREVGSAS